MKCNEFSRDLSLARYGQATKIKLSKNLYFGDVESAHLAGGMCIIETILNVHNKEPYETTDEIIGDLQIALSKHWNYYKRKYDYKNYSKIDIEDLIFSKFSEII